VWFFFSSAKPTWKFQPVDKRVSVGDSTSLNCQAEGNPKPTVEWYINGNPVKGKTMTIYQ
jgi:hypothetical protein